MSGCNPPVTDCNIPRFFDASYPALPFGLPQHSAPLPLIGPKVSVVAPPDPGPDKLGLGELMVRAHAECQPLLDLEATLAGLTAFSGSGWATDAALPAGLTLGTMPTLQTTLQTEVTALAGRWPSDAELALALGPEAEAPFWPLLPGLHFHVRGVKQRFPAGLAVIELVQGLSLLPMLQLKRWLNVPRPNDPIWGAPVEPLIPQPPHASLPAGHATMAYAVAGVMAKLRGAQIGDLHTKADAMIERRELCHLHTPSDSQAGKALGNWIAERLLDPATLAASPWWARLLRRALLE